MSVFIKWKHMCHHVILKHEMKWSIIGKIKHWTLKITKVTKRLQKRLHHETISKEINGSFVCVHVVANEQKHFKWMFKHFLFDFYNFFFLFFFCLVTPFGVIFHEKSIKKTRFLNETLFRFPSKTPYFSAVFDL